MTIYNVYVYYYILCVVMFMRLVSQYQEAHSELSQTFKDGVFYKDSQRP